MPPVYFFVVSRLGRVDETFDDLDEAIGVIVERHVPGLFEDLETRTGHRRVGQNFLGCRAG